MSAPAWVGFVCAAAAGAAARYALDLWIGARTDGTFPWGTFAINASGSLVLGLLTGLALFHGFPTTARLILGTGFCGAYTTFSTFTYETVRLLEEDAAGAALRNVAGTFVVCLASAIAGFAIAAM